MARTSGRGWRRAVVLALIGCSWAGPAGAEPGAYYARTWMTTQGVPHNVVTHLLADHAGFMWVATGGGLARFDGREFKEFPLPPELQRKGYNIHGIAELPGGALLVLLPDGNVAELRGAQYTVHPVTAALAGRAPMDVFVEPEGVIWIGTNDGTLLRWENGTASTYGRAEGIDRRAPAFSFARDAAGRTWIACGRFLGFFEHGQLRRFATAFGTTHLVAPSRTGGVWVLGDARLFRIELDLRVSPQAAGRTFTLPRQLVEDTAGGVWVATRRDGLFHFAGGAFEPIPLATELTLALAVDHEGSLWVGTEGWGVSLVRRRFCTLYARGETGTPGAETVCADRDGGVWTADRRSGVQHLLAGAWRPLDGTRELGVSTVDADTSGTLWVGAVRGLYRIDPAKPVPAAPEVGAHDVRVVFCAKDGAVWFGTNEGAVGRWHRGERWAEDLGGANRVTSIAENASGEVWLGTAAGELRHFVDGHFVVEPWPAGVPAVPVDALHFDRTDRLWIGTAAGVLVLDHGAFRRCTTADGLPDNLILQINEDANGQMWLGGSRGVFRLNGDPLRPRAEAGPRKLDVLRVGEDDGLPSLSLHVGSQPHAARDAAGQLWFTALQGLVRIDPHGFESPLALRPVVLEDIRLDGRALDPASPRHFPAGRHRLEFQLAVLSYAHVGSVKLQHMLEGIDPDWLDTEESRAASYSSLPPGRYTLRFRGRDGAGAAGPEGVVHFVVDPAWWQTWWATTAGGLAAIAVAYGGFRRLAHWRLRRQLDRLQREHALEKERARIARDLHDELGGSLALISFGVDQLKQQLGSPASATLLEQLGQRVRRHTTELRRVVWIESPTNDSLHRVCALIALFATDFFRGTPIACTVQQDDVVPPEPVGPEVQHHFIAIAKEAFSNILKHAGAKQVNVTLRYAAPVFTLTITDDGVGFSPAAEADPDHNGLSNMRTRAAEIGAELSLRSERGAGTALTLAWSVRSGHARLPAKTDGR